MTEALQTVWQALRTVFSERTYWLIGVASALVFAALFGFGSGLITIFPEGAFFELNAWRLATLLALIVLAGLVVPMQWYAIRKARSGLTTSAPGVGGMLTGLATMSCCAPLLLPAVLSFVGFSGTQLLFLNTAVRRFIAPLSLLSIAFLLFSLFLTARSVSATCRIDIKKLS